MDVTLLNKNTDYLKNYINNEEITQYTEIQNSTKNKAGVVNKSTESDSNLNSKEQDSFTKDELDKSLKKLNKFLEDDKTHAEYEKHKELGTIMVKIVDEKTNKVILELPPKKILDMVASMCEQVGILDKKA